jgi:hypothetical protein
MRTLLLPLPTSTADGLDLSASRSGCGHEVTLQIFKSQALNSLVQKQTMTIENLASILSKTVYSETVVHSYVTFFRILKQ